ncbi:signal peptide peptidase SppA [Helicobacter zhangjianzhongii]|uniref:Signal peptide peptidase SppA n=1 Tax=Helicobacter zhangjianzhongii TaxID=2974574 RepID=A0ACC6FSN1_9HELI|nr:MULTISPECIES: signal peptide peptidase SppA [unclassified Helicobacter]MDL0080180.1 signal peptide peptidase SppA [Helicobacter sp. CPD2-1]MDL0082241.1 signal peptide peptidase SppA [Helicobacter sp. XJK30-2]
MIKKFFAPFIAILECITKYFKAFVFLLIVAVLIFSTREPKQHPNLARIHLKGAIVDSAMLRTQIEDLRNYPSLQGVLLVIDSPGGAVGASVEMADLIKELASTMPVVVHTEGIMASGSYYAGVYASKIYANRGALIGSIGVLFNGANLQELFKKIGYEPQIIAAGEYKEIDAYYRDWTQKERAYIQNLIQEEYQTFITDVAKARNLELKDSSKFAEGRVFNAAKAKELGLIDDVISRNQAIDKLKELAQVEEALWLEKSSWQGYLDSLVESTLSRMLGSMLGVGLQ